VPCFPSLALWPFSGLHAAAPQTLDIGLTNIRGRVTQNIRKRISAIKANTAFWQTNTKNMSLTLMINHSDLTNADKFI
jgi:hypothetical protein